MRAIHLTAPPFAHGVLPLCGDWGSMDSDWTAIRAQVTCAACVRAMAHPSTSSELTTDQRTTG